MRSAIALTALCLALLGPLELRAQSLFGSSGGRSPGGGTISAGQRSFSGSGGSGALGMNGAGLDNQASVGQISGNERFVRGARQPGQFVGADTTDTTNISSIMQGGGNLQNTLRALSRNQANFNTQGGNRNSATQNKKQPRVHLGLSPEFALEAAARRVPNSALGTRLSNLPGLKLNGPVEVLLENRVATLRGSVATDRDRDLAAQLVLLEPGVSEVVNELVVQAAPEVLPAKQP